MVHTSITLVQGQANALLLTIDVSRYAFEWYSSNS